MGIHSRSVLGVAVLGASLFAASDAAAEIDHFAHARVVSAQKYCNKMVDRFNGAAAYPAPAAFDEMRAEFEKRLSKAVKIDSQVKAALQDRKHSYNGMAVSCIKALEALKLNAMEYEEHQKKFRERERKKFEKRQKKQAAERKAALKKFSRGCRGEKRRLLKQMGIPSKVHGGRRCKARVWEYVSYYTEGTCRQTLQWRGKRLRNKTQRGYCP